MTKGLLATVILLASVFAASAIATPVAFAAQCEPMWDAMASTEKSGCCSHHKGVCGCNNLTGMQRCCDGTDSPSCKCGE
jgi:hypothetical protein